MLTILIILRPILRGSINMLHRILIIKTLIIKSLLNDRDPYRRILSAPPSNARGRSPPGSFISVVLIILHLPNL